MNASNKNLNCINPSILVPKVLILKCNNIKKIENIPEGVEDLDLSYNQLRVIENLPLSLKILRVDYNLIRKITNIPKNLHTLYINGNRIKSIDSCFLGNIKHLYINNNPMKIIPYMKGIQTLHAENCNIRDISLLPNTLKELYIRHNSITIMKKLPSSLSTILFAFNPVRLVHFSGIPSSLHSRFRNYPKYVRPMRECDTCGICREKFKKNEEIVYCKYNCGIPVHAVCFKNCRHSICVFCRTTMIDPNDSNGSGSPSSSNELSNFINDTGSETSVSEVSESESESEAESEYSESE
jgi:hypothetical protein